MKYRFTRKSWTERRNIPKHIKHAIFKRDNFKCVFCNEDLSKNMNKLTLDHLIPISTHPGLNEKTNFVTACLECNTKKKNMPLKEFASQINIKIEDIPVTGDPVIDNKDLPESIRQIRKEIYDKIRKEELLIGGKSSQKKIEKSYRKNLAVLKIGKELEDQFPNLPAHVRSMIPEIKTISSNKNDFNLLLELAKSAITRNLIGTFLTKNCNVMEKLQNIMNQTDNKSLTKKINFAIKRYKKTIN